MDFEEVTPVAQTDVALHLPPVCRELQMVGRKVNETEVYAVLADAQRPRADHAV